MFEPERRLIETIEKMSGEVFELATWLTDHPEISGQEKESSRKVMDFMEKHGYEITAPYGGVQYSFKAGDKKADPNKPKIAVICEYDALPDVGHACGHSLSCGISVLTVLALRAMGDLPFTFDLVGTPDEEATGGKVVMSENGAFDGYELAIMSHLDNVNAPQNRILATNDMYITFFGRAAHSSFNPFDGVNAFNAAQLFFHAADMMRQHFKPDWQFHGIITKGGAAPNIVPERVEADVYLRSTSLTGLNELRAVLTNCVAGAALATGCTYTIDQRSGTYGDLFYPKSAEREMIAIYDALGQDYHIYDEYNGSTDMGNVDYVVPTLALSCRATDEYIPIHSKEFTRQLYGERGMKTLLDSTKVQASFLLELARRPEKLAEIQQEHRQYRQKPA